MWESRNPFSRQPQWGHCISSCSTLLPWASGELAALYITNTVVNPDMFDADESVWFRGLL